MPTYLTEDDTTSDLPAGVIMAVRGRAGTAGVVNANRRLYPASVYRRVVQAFEGRASGQEMLGELDHPGPLDGPRLGKTALRITGLSLSEGRRLEFSAHVLDTPSGRTLAGLLRSGVPVNVSTRGCGSLRRCCEPVVPETADGTDHPDHPYLEVGEDYELHGIDAVARGAHEGACMQAHEGLETEGSMPTLTEDLPGGAGSPSSNGSTSISPTGGPAGENPAGAGMLAARVRELEARLAEARSDLELIRAAGAAERESLVAALEQARTDLDATRVSFDAQCAEHAREMIEAHDARDLAIAQLNRSRVEEQTGALLSGLRPDVRKKVADQLARCQTPEEVTERWKSIEDLLSGAGLLSGEPAGSGRPDNGETPRSVHPAPALSPDQRVQRQLLGL